MCWYQVCVKRANSTETGAYFLASIFYVSKFVFQEILIEKYEYMTFRGLMIVYLKKNCRLKSSHHKQGKYWAFLGHFLIKLPQDSIKNLTLNPNL